MPAGIEPVVRYGRYTLVELSPLAGQEDLMQQIVDVSMPPVLVVSVADAVRYVLLRSGFTLCDSPEIQILNTLPLPAVDRELGPLTLGSALGILVGPGWHLEVNEVMRRICFSQSSPASRAGRSAAVPPTVSGSEARPLRSLPLSRAHRS